MNRRPYLFKVENLVTILLGLVRTIDRNAKVIGLLLRESGQLHADLFGPLRRASWEGCKQRGRLRPSCQGRWMSPDPYNGSYDFSDPQSFNRYAYARNNPRSFIDPSGLGYCDMSTAPDQNIQPGDAISCARAGGIWIVEDPTSKDPDNCMTSTSNCTVDVTDGLSDPAAPGAGMPTGGDGDQHGITGGGSSAPNNGKAVTQQCRSAP